MSHVIQKMTPQVFSAFVPIAAAGNGQQELFVVWVCDMTRSCVCDMTHSYGWDVTHSYMGHKNSPWYECVTWLIHVCVTWLIHMCVTWLIRKVCDMTHSYMCHRKLFVVECATWLIHVCDMTHSCLWHDSVLHIWMSHVTHVNESWRTYEWVMAHI